MRELKPWEQRFVKEVEELEERTIKLKAMLNKYAIQEFTGKDILGFTPKCPLELLKMQYDAMVRYLSILLQRAKIEDIDLSQIKFDGAEPNEKEM